MGISPEFILWSRGTLPKKGNRALGDPVKWFRDVSILMNVSDGVHRHLDGPEEHLSGPAAGGGHRAGQRAPPGLPQVPGPADRLVLELVPFLGVGLKGRFPFWVESPTVRRLQLLVGHAN